MLDMDVGGEGGIEVGADGKKKGLKRSSVGCAKAKAKTKTKKNALGVDGAVEVKVVARIGKELLKVKKSSTY